MSTPTPAAPAAVLWDFDGTLADTEPLWIEAEFELITTLGGGLVLREGRRAVGLHPPPAAPRWDRVDLRQRPASSAGHQGTRVPGGGDRDVPRTGSDVEHAVWTLMEGPCRLNR